MAIQGTTLLGGLHPVMADAVRQLLTICDQYGLSVRLTSGYRSNSEQAALFAKGRTLAEVNMRVRKRGAGGTVTDAPPGASPHNYGVAVDIESPQLDVVMDIARQMGFGLVSWDPDHIEYPGWQRYFLR